MTEQSVGVSTPQTEPEPLADSAVFDPARPLLDLSESYVGPAAVAFLAGAGIMAVEIVASRLASQYLGSSIFTWTSVIGVILAGITIGNYLGGRLADRPQPQSTLCGILLCAAVICMALPGWNITINDWEPLWTLRFDYRVAAHSFLTFVLPAIVFAMASPLVTKIALDIGRGRGRAVGSMSAWNVLGCIAGTFLTGFVLISWLGAAGTLILVSLAAAFFALLIATHTWRWLALGCLGFSAMGMMVASLPWTFTQQLAEAFGLRAHTSRWTLYTDESEYSFIRVERDDANRRHALQLDQLVHSYGRPDDPFYLGYDYERFYAALTERARPADHPMRTLIIGGGGYTYPRYFLARWPDAAMQVAEIDPAVTDAARACFGLQDDARLTIVHADGRNLVRNLLRRKQAGEPVEDFDFVYGDAVNDYAVPHHLTTLEYTRMINELLTPRGAYLINLIDIFNTGQFLGAVVNTFQKVFPDVYVFNTAGADPRAGDAATTRPGAVEQDTGWGSRRDTFVVVGSKTPLDLSNLGLVDQSAGVTYAIRPISEQRLRELAERSGGLVLTDDYAPVQHLLADVVRGSTRHAIMRYEDRAIRRMDDGDPATAAHYFRKAVELDPLQQRMRLKLADALSESEQAGEAVAILQDILRQDPGNADALNFLGIAFQALKRHADAVRAFEAALAARPDDPNINTNLGETYIELGRYEDALRHSLAAVKAFENDPRPVPLLQVGFCLNKLRRFEDAEPYLLQAANLDPTNPNSRFELGFNALQRGMNDKAAILYQQCLENNPNEVMAYFDLGLAFERLRRFEDAVLAHGQFVAMAPANAEAAPLAPKSHFKIAEILFKQLGRLDQAEEHYRAAISADPKYPNSYVGLMALYGQRADLPAVLKILQDGMAACPDDPAITKALMTIRATCIDHAYRDGGEAVRLAERLTKDVEAREPDLLYLTAAAYAQDRQFDRAIAESERALQMVIEQKNEAFAGEIRRCLDLYRAGKVFERKAPATATTKSS